MSLHTRTLLSIAALAALAACSTDNSPTAATGPNASRSSYRNTGLSSADRNLTQNEQLGKKLFFDTKLSTPSGLACAGCHGAEVGYTGPDAAINAAGAVYEGAMPGRFGNRKPPSAAYAGDSPILHFDGTKWVGGMFWDGRATGWTLGDPLAEQAQGPFLNPLEQNNASAQVVIDKVLASNYSDLFLQVCTDSDTAKRYECIGRAIAEYERSKEVNPFSSKFDAYLDNKAKLTKQEDDGFRLFVGKGNCANCHSATPAPSSDRPLFTDFTFDNLGIPKNPANPFYAMPPEFNPDGMAWVDPAWAGSSLRCPTTPNTRTPTSASTRSPPCATWTSGRIRASSRLTGTTAISSRSRESCISTTPATCRVRGGMACPGRRQRCP